MNEIKVLGIQFEPIIGDKNANFKKVEGFLEKHATLKPDIIVLPELFNTGILPKDSFAENAEDLNGLTISKLSKWSKRFKCYIVGGSFAEKASNGKFLNTTVCLNPRGEIISKYSKTHMFSYFGHYESDLFKPGEELAIAQTPWGKIGFSICYDLRFPEVYRNLSLNGVTMIFTPSAWPYPRLDHWLTLNKSRAIENQCFIIAVNQIGNTVNGIVNLGNSMIIDPWGTIIANAGEKEGVIYSSLSLSESTFLREQFPVLSDRNENAYKSIKIF